jgi:SAM-dependent methyltransferase
MPYLDATRLSRCPVCAGASLTSLPTPGRWIGREVFSDLAGILGLVKCRSCSLVFVNPRPSAGRLARFYAGEVYDCHEPSQSTTTDAKADYILGKMALHLPYDAPRRLLDYGAGGGGFMLQARERGWRVHGFEPGRRGLEFCAKERLHVTSDPEGIPPGKFGLVTLNHVLEHLEHPVEVLRGLLRVLNPAGRIYIEVPNARSLRALLAQPLLTRRFGIDERYRAFPIHLMYYSDQTLRRVVTAAGWKVEASFTLGLGLDEFFLDARAGASSDRACRAADAPCAQGHPRASLPAGCKRVWHLLRDAFLGLGAGENLAVIARPRCPGSWNSASALDSAA